jgi:hypothetical protein
MAICRVRDKRTIFHYDTLYQKEPEFLGGCALIVWHGPVYYHKITDRYIGKSFE